MLHLSPELQFFIHLSKIASVMQRKFDARLMGLSFTEFTILYYLFETKQEKIRRVDLSEKIGLTASGITRLLAPMEKIGLIKRETDTSDARVSYVALAPSGKRMLKDTLENAEDLAKNSLLLLNDKQVEKMAENLNAMSAIL